MTHKFISVQETGYTANDAEVLETLDFGNIMPNGTYVSKFVLGNTGEDEEIFHIGATSVNSGIIEDFELSDDDSTYVGIETGIDVKIKSNQRSDTIFLRYNCQNDAYISEGTIKLYASGLP